MDWQALDLTNAPKPTLHKTFGITREPKTLRSVAAGEAVIFEAFIQFDNYDTWNAAAVPATITRDGWLKVSVPPTVGPGGKQRVGVQFLNSDAAYTGEFYVDGVSW